MTTLIPMSANELEALRIVESVQSKRLTSTEAAERASVTTRTIRRWKAKVVHCGPQGLVHGNRGKPSPRKVPAGEASRILSLVTDRYPDCTAAFIVEKFAARHRIHRDPKTVAEILRSGGAWESPQARSRTKPFVHRQWRERRAHHGSLVQFDGSYHNWLEGRDGTNEQCLLAAIDDATGNILLARFADNEGVLPVMGFWLDYTLRSGLPKALYLDRFSTYRMSQRAAQENPDLKTQFERAMATLGVDLVFANSPQAKGRVERLFHTLQDRLVKELRLAQVQTVDRANRFLEIRFLPAFNRRFGRPPQASGDFHRPLSAGERRTLPDVFCRIESRLLHRDFTCNFRNQWYQALPTRGLALRPGDMVVVREYPDGRRSFTVRNHLLAVESIGKRPLLHPRLPLILAPTERTQLLPVKADIFISR